MAAVLVLPVVTGPATLAAHSPSTPSSGCTVERPIRRSLTGVLAAAVVVTQMVATGFGLVSTTAASGVCPSTPCAVGTPATCSTLVA